MLERVVENEIILREGDKDENLYKVLSGKVEVYTSYGSDKEMILGILSEGDFFGELGVLTSAPAIYTVVAHGNALLLTVKKEDLFKYLKKNHNDLMAIMSNMANAMLNMKMNIDLLNQDVNDLLKDRSETKKAQELKRKISESDIRRAMMMYKDKQMTL